MTTSVHMDREVTGSARPISCKSPFGTPRSLSYSVCRSRAFQTDRTNTQQMRRTISPPAVVAIVALVLQGCVLVAAPRFASLRDHIRLAGGPALDLGARPLLTIP